MDRPSARRSARGQGRVVFSSVLVALVLGLVNLGGAGAHPATSDIRSLSTPETPGPLCGGTPNISITATPNNGTVPLTVHFTSNVSGGCPPYEIEWELGDESERAGPSITYTYGSAGTFHVLAKVQDSAGQLSSDQATVTVHGGGGPLRVAVTVLPSTGTAPLAVNAWANVTGGNASATFTVQWNFGDGGTGSGSPVSHLYDHAGSFVATATVHGPLSTAKGNATVTVTPGGPPVTANLSLAATPAYVNAPADVSITAYSNGVGSPYQLLVCFGDATPCEHGPANWTGAFPASFLHDFNSSGNFPVVGTLEDRNGTVLAGATVVVWVSAGPALTVNASGILDGDTVPVTATFVANVTGGTPPYSIQWSFGDGTVGASVSGVPVSHAYRTAGTFFPLVEVRDSGDNQANATLASVSVVGTTPGVLPESSLGLPTTYVLILLILASLVIGAIAGRWTRRRARKRLLRREGEQLVRELEERH